VAHQDRNVTEVSSVTRSCLYSDFCSNAYDDKDINSAISQNQIEPRAFKQESATYSAMGFLLLIWMQQFIIAPNRFWLGFN